MIYLNCITAAVLTGYVLRYLWPLSISIFWQTIPGPIARGLGATVPDDKYHFFYAPSSGQPLVVTWWHPHHIVAIPTLALTGIFYVWVFQTVGGGGEAAIRPLIKIASIIWILFHAVNWLRNALRPAEVVKRLVFVGLAVVESYAVLAAVGTVALTK